MLSATRLQSAFRSRTSRTIEYCRLTAALLILALVICPLAAQSPKLITVTELQRQFENPPPDSRIMMRWWWFGPAVTHTEIERELRVMKDAGIGGVEIQPVYPLALDNENLRTLPFLSDAFVDALRFANDKAHELGLRVDLTIGSGWPYGGPTVPVGDSAGRLRIEKVRLTDGLRRIPLPNISIGERLIGAFLVNRINDGTIQAGTRELTNFRDGSVYLPDQLTGKEEVEFFVSSRTGQQVKRAAVGAEGFVLNHYDRGAVERYLARVGDRLLQAFDKHPPTAIFCDSLEVYQSDWTPDFLDEFKRRRGYDLRPLLPALGDSIGPDTAAIRHDWGETLTELLNERFLVPVHEWARKHNTQFRIQGYGIPPMTLSGNRFADLPEGEGFEWRAVRASRWAASASHIYGREVTSSETWTWLHSPSFRATPLDMKAEADLHFLQGINQLIGHGFPYTAEGVEYPGWRFYAAAAFSEKNPWWIVMPDVSRYLQRISLLMRRGSPANDVAVYLPNHDAWAGSANGKLNLIDMLRERVGEDVLPSILQAGFNPDLIDDEALALPGIVENGVLNVGGARYRAVILPGVERIPAATLRRLEEFANKGGVVIATRRIPSLPTGYKAVDRKEVADISRRLFQSTGARGYMVAGERTELGARLAELIQPDLSFSPSNGEIGYLRRQINGGDVFFIANTSNTVRQVTASFRKGDVNPEVWNPFDGSVTGAAAEPSGKGVSMTIELAPYESRVVVFSNRRVARSDQRSVGRPILDLSSDWRLSAGEKIVGTGGLNSWTENPDFRFYSGTVIYEKRFEAPAPKGAGEFYLDFGEGRAIPATPRTNGYRAWLDSPVREAARVFLNGQDAGSVWCPPYSLNVTRLLRSGENEIRIVVGNTAINYLAGTRLPNYRLLNLRYGERFQDQDVANLQPLPSGLLGPIRLINR